MATEKPFVFQNTFKSTIGVKRDSTGQPLRDKEGVLVPDERTFIIEVEYKDVEALRDAAIKYSTWRVQAKVRAHFIGNKKGKKTTYGLMPNTRRRVDPEGNLMLSREDKKAKLLAELAAIEAEERAERTSQPVGESSTDALEYDILVDEDGNEGEEGPNGK